jgi:hypothetical protein
MVAFQKYSGVHFGLIQNEPKDQEEFNSSGLPPIYSLVGPVASPLVRQKFFGFLKSAEHRNELEFALQKTKASTRGLGNLWENQRYSTRRLRAISRLILPDSPTSGIYSTINKSNSVSPLPLLPIRI